MSNQPDAALIPSILESDPTPGFGDRRRSQPLEILPWTDLADCSRKSIISADALLTPYARAIAVLNAFEIPYAILDVDGKRLHVATSLEEMLSSDPHPDFWVRVTALVRSELHSSMRRRTQIRCGQVAISVHPLRVAHGVQALVLVRPGHASPDTALPTSATCLTDRENMVARLLASGLAIKEIGAKLGISRHTARHHTERIYFKLGVRNRVAVARAVGLEGA